MQTKTHHTTAFPFQSMFSSRLTRLRYITYLELYSHLICVFFFHYYYWLLFCEFFSHIFFFFRFFFFLLFCSCFHQIIRPVLRTQRIFVQRRDFSFFPAASTATEVAKWTTNTKLRSWVEEQVKLFGPEHVHLCDGMLSGFILSFMSFCLYMRCY